MRIYETFLLFILIDFFLFLIEGLFNLVMVKPLLDLIIPFCAYINIQNSF